MSKLIDICLLGCWIIFSPTLIKRSSQLANIKITPTITSNPHPHSYWMKVLTNKWGLKKQPKLTKKFHLSLYSIHFKIEYLKKKYSKKNKPTLIHVYLSETVTKLSADKKYKDKYYRIIHCNGRPIFFSMQTSLSCKVLKYCITFYI